MASLSDIAQDLGISVSLVSKVLNDNLGTTRASTKTAHAIRKRAMELGYRKNRSAVALKSGRQNVLGVFVHRQGLPGSGLNEHLMEGIAFEAMKFHQSISLTFFEAASEFRSSCEHVHRGTMDGLIVGGVRHTELEKDLLRLNAEGLKVVTILNDELHPLLPNVKVDQGEVARMATHHLIERGCRRIAQIGGEGPRLDGYKAALREAGLPTDEALVCPCNEDDFVFEVGVRGAEYLLAGDAGSCLLAGRFDGVVAQSDQQAVGALNTFLRAGLRVPDDVRLIGIDNSAYCEFSMISLSSISQEFQQRGRLAVRMLMDAVAGKQVRSVTVKPVLHVRQSSK